MWLVAGVAVLRDFQCLVIAASVVAATQAFAQDAGNNGQVSREIPGLTRPTPGLTNPEAIRAFVWAMFACAGTRFEHKMLADAPPEVRNELQSASEADRRWAGPSITPESPVWVTKHLGHLLTIAEPSLDRCEVAATQLPVERTVTALNNAVVTTFPEFKIVALKPGYDPIAYQYELVRDDTRYILHVEGAEPGAPGHELRFSLLLGAVVRQPATDAPPYR